MKTGASLVFLITLISFTSCKTYEVKHYKGVELDKAGNISKYNVYVHAPKNSFAVKKPSASQTGITGETTLLKDKKEVEEIKNPSTPDLVKKHRHDLNLVTKTDIADSTHTLSLKKTDISEYTLTITHSSWGSIGEGIADGLGIALSLAALGAVVYWFTLNPW